MGITISLGFSEAEKSHVAQLFWQAFSVKLGRIMGPDARAVQFFNGCLNPNFALVARDEQGQLLGVAGFRTDAGGLVDGSLQDMARVYGWVGGIWRGLLLSLLERKVQPDVFQMDGLFVDASARGLGVGTALLEAVFQEAHQRQLDCVQLDVIDINPRARALYERVGFVPISEEETGPLVHIFGFSKATRMEKTLGEPTRP
ncbi:N-acetyltransferase [Phaeobacter gallaeciensis]|uniref:N-acetyltransferase n=2 Tax=Roseobacteraceae TaxID=2854170 RepID=A0A366WLE0_9RHOB|nr:MULTISPECIES: GNAT family N-acetyltransferase [Roseobacteraceae]MBT3141461.1 GNAT family N-acetyltransferase [Falsiruegeria litorea]MBT8167397.1 GNAT family N-acetyltransferase [Falsiruegeria litorea]RBW50968.1 N-acetyltransferase [Phaeobacter gallaeciensis]